MGGDTPLDELGTLAAACGVKFDYDNEFPDAFHCYPFSRDIINTHLGKLLDVSMTRCEDKWADHIIGQVLGTLIMQYGAGMPREVRQHILDCIDEDVWAKEGDADRQLVMAKFARQVLEYPAFGGDPVQDESLGLLEKIVNGVQ
jgi:hypothetical protein